MQLAQPADPTEPIGLTWSVDHGSDLYRVEISQDTVEGQPVSVVRFLTTPKDLFHRPQAGQIVEILPWDAILPNQEKTAASQGFLARVETSYNATDQSLVVGQVLFLG